VVLGAAAGFATGPALYQNLSSLFIPDLQAAFGWNRGEIATVAGLGLLAAFAAPVVGRIADRRGVLPVLVASALVLAGGHILLANVSGPIWQFGIGVALLALAAPGLSTLVFGRLIANRFDRNRGLALGIATTGISLSTLLLPPLFSVTIAEYGWRFAYYLLAALALGVGLPLALIAVRAAGPLPKDDQQPARLPADGWRHPLSWRDPVFLAIAGSITLINIGTVGMVTQLALIAGERGIALASAGLVVSAYGLSQVVGRLGIGVLVDRFPAGRMAALFALASAVGFALLAAGVEGLPAIVAAVFLAGLMNGAEHDLVPYLVSRLFPIETFGRVLGRLVAVGILSGGAGIVAFGWLREGTASYTPPLAVATVAMLLVVALFLRLPARR
jgi:MFS family permease